MKLLSLEFEGCLGVRDASLRFDVSNDGAPFVVLTGDAGSGKTSILDIIVAAKEDVGPYAPLAFRKPVVSSRVASARITAEWWLHPAERWRDAPIVTTISRFGDGAPLDPKHPPELTRLFRGGSRRDGQGTFEYFHANRELARLSGEAVLGLTALGEQLGFLSVGNEKYLALGPWLADQIQTDNQRAAGRAIDQGIALPTAGPLLTVREALAPFLIDKAFNGLRAGAKAAEAEFVTPGGESLPLEQLCATERAGVLFALTALRRNLANSVVLIDEPELHLGPAEQAATLSRFAELCPGAQLIVATRAPEVAALSSSPVVAPGRARG